MSAAMAKKQASFLLRHALQSFGVIFAIAVLVRTFFVSSLVMSGMSMSPNIWPGDFLVGRKWRLSHVLRGDVVVLRCPNTRGRLCMKRVIGLEGDRIEFLGGRLMVNGLEVKERQLSEAFRAEAIGDRTWMVWPAKSSGEAEAKPAIIPPRHIYLLNDKRSDFNDSRTWGAVPMDLLEAKLSFIWLSLDWSDGDQVRTWPEMRWSRFFRSVD
jgi:signal peptidase I